MNTEIMTSEEPPPQPQKLLNVSIFFNLQSNESYFFCYHLHKYS